MLIVRQKTLYQSTTCIFQLPCTDVLWRSRHLSHLCGRNGGLKMFVLNCMLLCSKLMATITRDAQTEKIFLHAKPWIPGCEISIFTAVIHQWRSPLRQIARARTIDEYDVTMPVSYIRVTSQINCGDVTILNQKRPSLATMANSAIDNCFNGIVCSGHQIASKK